MIGVFMLGIVFCVFMIVSALSKRITDKLPTQIKKDGVWVDEPSPLRNIEIETDNRDITGL